MSPVPAYDDRHSPGTTRLDPPSRTIRCQCVSQLFVLRTFNPTTVIFPK
jgi:hypothetical protein